jgi:hypothetical protein
MKLSPMKQTVLRDVVHFSSGFYLIKDPLPLSLSLSSSQLVGCDLFIPIVRTYLVPLIKGEKKSEKKKKKDLF